MPGMIKPRAGNPRKTTGRAIVRQVQGLSPSLLAYVRLQEKSGLIVEYYDIRTGKTEDYGLNINDNTPLLILALWHHYNATGDEDFLREVYPAAAKAARYILSQRNAQGLVWCPATGTPDWMFGEAWSAAGDLAEIVALLVDTQRAGAPPPSSELSLSELIETRLLPLRAADEERKREAVLALQIAQQREVLRLDGEVEARRRLVGDEQPRLARNAHRADDALAHAARHLMRILADARGGRGDADGFQERGGPLPRTASGHALVHAQRLGHLVADREQGVQRRHRILEDHGDLLAADLADLLG